MNKPPPLLPANSARRALAILGNRWTLLILRDAFFGVRQFNEWQARIGITPSVLSARLKQLVEAGLLKRVTFREAPPRIEYRLTDQALDVYPFALMLMRWDQRWYGGRPRIKLTHTRCDHASSPKFTCGSCKAEVTAHDVRYEPGPGARDERATPTRLRRATITASDKRASHHFLEHVIDMVGDRWTAEVVAAAFFGTRRFDDIKTHTGIATNILSHRLRLLTADGILARRVYQERPQRHEYVLTEKGLDLYPHIVMLMRWGDRWLAGKEGPPLLLFHKTCGAPLDPRVTCSHCHEELVAQDVKYEVED